MDNTKPAEKKHDITVTREGRAGDGAGTQRHSGHGFDAEAQERHRAMAGAISDCDVLLAGGLGEGAYRGIEDAGMRLIPTVEREIDAAVRAYLAGTLENHGELLH